MKNKMFGTMGKSLLAEFMGTLTFVLIACGTLAQNSINGGTDLSTAIVFAFALIFSIYTWSLVSAKVHLNPAFTIGCTVAGHMGWLQGLLYIVAQILGAIVAVSILLYFVGQASGLGQANGILTTVDPFKAMIIEAVLTFFLVLVFSMVFSNPAVGAAAGIIVGLALGAMMLFALPLTGASLNMARQTATSIFVPNGFSTYWIYIVGGLVGALVAGVVVRVFMADWNPCVDETTQVMITEKVEEGGRRVTNFVKNVGHSAASALPSVSIR